MKNTISHINHFLTQQNISQRQLSRLTNIPVSTLNDNLANRTKMSNSNLLKIAKVLNIDIEDLSNCHILSTFLKSPQSTNHTLLSLDSPLLLQLKTADLAPSHINKTLPVIVLPKSNYLAHELIIYTIDKHYVIDTYNNVTTEIHDNIIGSVVAQISNIL